MIRRKTSPSLVLAALIMLATLLTLCIFSAYSSLAFADETSPNKLDVMLTPTQESFGKNDIASIDLDIVNNTGMTHYDVSHELTIPEGLELVDASAPTNGDHGNIEHGGSSHVSIQLRLSSSQAAFTGDNSSILLLVLIVVIAAIIVVTIRKRRGNRLLSVMLIVGLVTCGLSLPHVAFANEVTSSHSSTNSIAVNLAGEDYVVGVLVQSQTKTNINDDPANGGNDGNQNGGEPVPGITYQDDVVVINGEYWENADLDNSALSIHVFGGYPKEIKIGDKIVAEPNEKNPFGTTLIVTSIKKMKDGITIEGDEPEINEIIKSIYANGVSETDVHFVPAENVEVEVDDENSEYTESGSGIARRSLLPDVNWSGAIEGGKLTVKLKEYGLTFSITPSVDYVIDYREGDLKELKLAFNLEEKIKANFKMKYEHEIPIGEVYFPTEVPGLWIKGEAVGKLSASGEISFSVKNTTTIGFQYKNKEWSPICSNSPTADAGFEAKLKASLEVNASAAIFGCLDLAETGLEGSFSYKPDTPVVRDSGMVCLDMVTSFDSSINASAMEGLLKYSVDLVESEMGRMHFEDMKLVKDCTWKEEKDPEDSEDDELESDKYGETPQFNSGAYGERLVEPFNINAGKSMQFGAVGASMTIGSSWWFINYECAPGTIFKMTYLNSDGTTQEAFTTGFTSFGKTDNRCAGEPILIEVYLGRVTITSLYAYSAPPCTAGACDVVSYPLHISDQSISLKMGEAKQLAISNDFESILGESVSCKASWSSSNDSVARVSDGLVEGVGSGTATITCTYGDNYKVKCKVVVE